jgi:hypothetical protein
MAHSGGAAGAHGDAHLGGQDGQGGLPSASSHEGVAEGTLRQRVGARAEHGDGHTAALHQVCNHSKPSVVQQKHLQP